MIMNDEVEVTVDGLTYRLSELSEAAQEQVANLQFVDKEMAELNARLAVYQTARNAYQAALQQLVPRTTQ
jgi:DNA repair ATPase RecN